MRKFIINMAIIASLLSGGKVAQAGERHVEVLPGDTLYSIATANSISLSELIEVNPQIADRNLIFPGQLIRLVDRDDSHVDSKVVSDVIDEEPSVDNVQATPYEVDLLARLVEAEAGSEPFAGKVAVAQVVLNRVANDQFPGSIESVIYQAGQFSPVANGAIYTTASSDSVEAVQIAVANGGNAYGALYFYNPAIASGQSWFYTLETVEYIGNHVFKR